ncbi:DUF4920 domain-containing protein [Myroides phaeus]|uniref:DUF4920 domain-containing protein n=1 Tax=Myroides phaeus TaxID=702745 RepID=UPI002DB870A9|nr:DUF4920 domain-containing protein [Myroides phaeus]MEC4117171.1 DUF4920 domain-containing protein [Myroides phaeus]
MRKVVACLGLLTLIFTGCKNEKTVPMAEQTFDTTKYEYFGDSIALTDVLSKDEMLEKFKTMQAGDTLQVKFQSSIVEVCQKKGCWMSVELPGDKNSFVRFTDYGFFAPMNAAGHEVIVDGKAFVSVISVDELKHYAKDAGKSEEEIAAIVDPKVTYSFVADGIAIDKAQ